MGRSCHRAYDALRILRWWSGMYSLPPPVQKLSHQMELAEGDFRRNKEEVMVLMWVADQGTCWSMLWMQKVHWTNISGWGLSWPELGWENTWRKCVSACSLHTFQCTCLLLKARCRVRWTLRSDPVQCFLCVTSWQLRRFLSVERQSFTGFVYVLMVSISLNHLSSLLSSASFKFSYATSFQFISLNSWFWCV